ncbi:transposase [Nonomuraea insulae]|uniref:Transposase n=1 Tax=Nonomuraea insulae TaxID=1616787 RepID=A0ABW1DBD2_9ACTN
MFLMVMKNYLPEFEADVVALVLSRPDRTITSIARDLGVSRETLRVWVRAAQARGEGGQRGVGAATVGKAASGGHVPSDDVLEEDSPVAPVGVLPNHTQDEGADGADRGWAPTSLRSADAGVTSFHQIAVPPGPDPTRGHLLCEPHRLAEIR